MIPSPIIETVSTLRIIANNALSTYDTFLKMKQGMASSDAIETAGDYLLTLAATTKHVADTLTVIGGLDGRRDEVSSTESEASGHQARKEESGEGV